MKRKTLSKKEIKQINEKIEKYNFKFDKKEIVECIEDEKFKFIKNNDHILFFYLNEKIIPSLRLILEQENLSIKKITVDMGAIKFVVNGADIMRPGIVNIEEDISENDIVIIIDENNKKPLAIGKSLLNSKDMKEKKKGKVVKNLHWIGDEIWN